MTNLRKIFTKQAKSSSIIETSSTVIKISYPQASPQALIGKWEEVLETLGKSAKASEGERLAREIIKEELARLRKTNRGE
jgi:hypothetical protein